MVRQTAASQLAGRPLTRLGTFASIGNTGMIITWRCAVGVPARKAGPATSARPPGCPMAVCLPSRCARDASHPAGKARSASDELASRTRSAHPLEVGMDSVSYTALSPLSFLERSARVWPDKVAVVYGARRLTYRELAAEAQRVARALRASGVGPGDRVAYLMPNLPEMLIAHYRGPAGRRGACRGKHPAHGRGGGLYPESLGREDHGCRRGASFRPQRRPRRTWRR